MSQRLSVEDVVEQQAEVRVDRVVARELVVEVLGEHLDVAGLVHHLRGRVVLGVDPRHGLDDAGGAEQRALLAVHELREQPVLRLDAELDPLLLGPLLERRALEVDALGEEALVGLDVLERELHLVDLGRPVEVGGDVPLRRLGLLVELDERRAAALVVPREHRVGVRLHRVHDRVGVGVADREDRLEIVDLVASDQFHVAWSLRDSFGGGGGCECRLRFE